MGKTGFCFGQTVLQGAAERPRAPLSVRSRPASLRPGGPDPTPPPQTGRPDPTPPPQTRGSSPASLPPGGPDPTPPPQTRGSRPQPLFPQARESSSAPSRQPKPHPPYPRSSSASTPRAAGSADLPAPSPWTSESAESIGPLWTPRPGPLGPWQASVCGGNRVRDRKVAAWPPRMETTNRWRQPSLWARKQASGCP